MSKQTPNPGAPVSARKNVQKAERAANAALEKYNRAEARYFRAVLDFAHATAVKNRDTGVPHSVARAEYEVREITGLAVEAAAAKLLGGSERTAATAAKYKAIAAVMAAEAAKRHRVAAVA